MNECSRAVAAVDVTYCKVPLESLGPSVGVVTTNLTVVVDVQSMEFIQPVWDGLEQGESRIRSHGKETQRSRVESVTCPTSPGLIVSVTFPSQPRGRFLGL